MQDQLKIHGEGSTKKEKSEAKRLNYIIFESKYCTSYALSLLFKYLVGYNNNNYYYHYYYHYDDDDDDNDDDDVQSLSL